MKENASALELVHQLAETEGVVEAPTDITLTDTRSLQLPDLRWRYYNNPPARLVITNTGHTVNVGGKWESNRSYLRDGPFRGQYVFAQMHFHWGPNDESGSEHSVDGCKMPMELHVVHINRIYRSQETALKEKDGVAIVTYLFQLQDEDNPDLTPIVEALPMVSLPQTSTTIPPFAIGSLILPFEKDYLMYWGSVTSPTCQHIILWLTSRVPLGISSGQLTQFRQIRDVSGQYMVKNFRETHPRKTHTLFHISPLGNVESTLLPVFPGHRAGDSAKGDSEAADGPSEEPSVVLSGEGAQKTSAEAADGGVPIGAPTEPGQLPSGDAAVAEKVPSGAPGAPGEAGAAGTGASGAPGAPGEAGAAGTGASGAPGAPGEAGAAGTGAPGTPGVPGEAGAAGTGAPADGGIPGSGLPGDGADAATSAYADGGILDSGLPGDGAEAATAAYADGGIPGSGLPGDGVESATAAQADGGIPGSGLPGDGAGVATATPYDGEKPGSGLPGDAGGVSSGAPGDGGIPASSLPEQAGGAPSGAPGDQQEKTSNAPSDALREGDASVKGSGSLAAQTIIDDSVQKDITADIGPDDGFNSLEGTVLHESVHEDTISLGRPESLAEDVVSPETEEDGGKLPGESAEDPDRTLQATQQAGADGQLGGADGAGRGGEGGGSGSAGGAALSGEAGGYTGADGAGADRGGEGGGSGGEGGAARGAEAGGLSSEDGAGLAGEGGGYGSEGGASRGGEVGSDRDGGGGGFAGEEGAGRGGEGTGGPGSVEGGRLGDDGQGYAVEDREAVGEGGEHGGEGGGGYSGEEGGGYGGQGGEEGGEGRDEDGYGGEGGGAGGASGSGGGGGGGEKDREGGEGYEESGEAAGPEEEGEQREGEEDGREYAGDAAGGVGEEGDVGEGPGVPGTLDAEGTDASPKEADALTVPASASAAAISGAGSRASAAGRSGAGVVVGEGGVAIGGGEQPPLSAGHTPRPSMDVAGTAGAPGGGGEVPTEEGGGADGLAGPAGAISGAPGEEGAPAEPGTEPVEGAPAEGAPAEGAPAEGAPAEGAAAEGAPTEEAPAEGGPAEAAKAEPGPPPSGPPQYKYFKPEAMDKKKGPTPVFINGLAVTPATIFTPDDTREDERGNVPCHGKAHQTYEEEKRYWQQEEASRKAAEDEAIKFSGMTPEERNRMVAEAIKARRQARTDDEGEVPSGTGWPFEPFHSTEPLLSPININLEGMPETKLRPLVFDGHFVPSLRTKISNTGETVEVRVLNPELTPSIRGGPLTDEYIFDSMHFHWTNTGPPDSLGGVHTVDSHRTCMEIHMLHYSSQYPSKSEALKHPAGLCVVAFLLHVGGAENVAFGRLSRELARIEQALTSCPLDFNAMACCEEAAASHGYVAYPGTLVGRKDELNVVWVVFPKPIGICCQHSFRFRKLRTSVDYPVSIQPLTVHEVSGRPLVLAVPP